MAVHDANYLVRPNQKLRDHHFTHYLRVDQTRVPKMMFREWLTRSRDNDIVVHLLCTVVEDIDGHTAMVGNNAYAAFFPSANVGEPVHGFTHARAIQSEWLKIWTREFSILDDLPVDLRSSPVRNLVVAKVVQHRYNDDQLRRAIEAFDENHRRVVHLGPHQAQQFQVF